MWLLWGNRGTYEEHLKKPKIKNPNKKLGTILCREININGIFICVLKKFSFFFCHFDEMM